jgi:hypothetical protein
MQALFIDSRPIWFLAVCMFVGCDASTTVQPAKDLPAETAAVAGTVDLVVDFTGERANVKVAVPCSTDSTVFQILERASSMGDLEFDSQGAGVTAFVHAINGTMNQRARGKVAAPFGLLPAIQFDGFLVNMNQKATAAESVDRACRRLVRLGFRRSSGYADRGYN